MTARPIICAAALAAALGACSSRPRQFVPTLNALPSDQTKYEADYRACQVLVAAGHRSNFGARIASGGAGVVTGIGVGAATMAGSGGTMVGAMAAASTAMVAMPVVGLAAARAWGMAKRQKSRKEREIKEATALCLSEQGYTVASWDAAK